MAEYKETKVKRFTNLPNLFRQGSTLVRVDTKTKPNEKCICGSGKKYKKCCG